MCLDNALLIAIELFNYYTIQSSIPTYQKVVDYFYTYFLNESVEAVPVYDYSLYPAPIGMSK
jgi:hypothetical protein